MEGQAAKIDKLNKNRLEQNVRQKIDLCALRSNNRMNEKQEYTDI